MPNALSAILMPQMGFGGMPDTGAILKALAKRNVPVYAPEVIDHRRLKEVPWPDIGLVELRDMRGGLADFRRFTSISSYIKGKLVAEFGSASAIPIVPNPSATNWLFNKSIYFDDLIAKGIKTLPTKIFHTGHEPESTLEVAVALGRHIASLETEVVVLKPSRGALASRLMFLEKHGNDHFTAVWHTKRNERTIFEFKSQKDLIGFLVEFISNLAEQFADIFVQPFIKNVETSAIFIGGCPHFVRRMPGAERIAHEAYGGTNEIVAEPSAVIRTFASQVFDSLPKTVQKSTFIRIDIVESTKTGELMLGEIEGAAATRLWLNEAGRVDEYADLLVERLRSSVNIG